MVTDSVQNVVEHMVAQLVLIVKKEGRKNFNNSNGI